LGIRWGFFLYIWGFKLCSGDTGKPLWKGSSYVNIPDYSNARETKRKRVEVLPTTQVYRNYYTGV